MHTKDARAEGETEQRLYRLAAWQETPFYTPRERAALEWAETLTLIASHHVPDELYASTREHFTEARTGRLDARRHRHQRLEPRRDPVPR